MADLNETSEAMRRVVQAHKESLGYLDSLMPETLGSPDIPDRRVRFDAEAEGAKILLAGYERRHAEGRREPAPASQEDHHVSTAISRHEDT